MDLSIENCFEVLQDRHYLTRVKAGHALGRMGPEVEQVIPTLVATLLDPCLGLRDVAAEALGALGSRAHPAIPALHIALTARNGFVRNAARRALEKIDR